MDRRLHCIYQMISPGKGVIDVGTDHAYLPVALAKGGYPGKIFASDIGEGPLAAARRSAAAAGCEDTIRFLLCDGLHLCPPDAVDTIVIAGMGGDTICGILDRDEWCMNPAYTLILQPMTRAEVLRYWLIHNDFAITRERLVEENGNLYTVLSAVYGGNMRLSDAELFTGSRDLLADDVLFGRMIRRQRARFEKMLVGMQKGAGEKDSDRVSWLTSILAELKEMEIHVYGA